MTSPNPDLVQQHLGDDGIAQLTQHLGVDPGTAKAAAAAALPMLVQAMSNRSSAPGGGSAMSGVGAGGLGGLLGGLGGLFGGNHAEAAQQVSHKTGLDMHTAEKALLFLAPLVLARFTQQHQQAAPASPASANPNVTGAGAAPPPAAAEHESALGKVMGAVDKIFHR